MTFSPNNIILRHIQSTIDTICIWIYCTKFCFHNSNKNSVTSTFLLLEVCMYSQTVEIAEVYCLYFVVKIPPNQLYSNLNWFDERNSLSPKEHFVISTLWSKLISRNIFLWNFLLNQMHEFFINLLTISVYTL